MGRPRKYTINRRPGIGHPIHGAHLPIFSKEMDGCSFSPSCFTCPLPECKWEKGASVKRGAEAVELQRMGMAVPLIANKLGVSRRTAQKYVKEGSSNSEAQPQPRKRMEPSLA